MVKESTNILRGQKQNLMAFCREEMRKTLKHTTWPIRRRNAIGHGKEESSIKTWQGTEYPMEVKLGGEKVHVKLTWELLTLVTAVSHGFEQRPFKLRKVKGWQPYRCNFCDLSCVPSTTALEVRLSQPMQKGRYAFFWAFLLLCFRLALLLVTCSCFVLEFFYSEIAYDFYGGKIAW